MKRKLLASVFSVLALAAGLGLAVVTARASTGDTPANTTPPPPTTTGGTPPPKAQPPPPVPKCTVKGTATGEIIRGTRRPDVICAGGGADRIYGTGLDVIIAGPGNDTVYARNGRSDVIFGGPGIDRARIDAKIDVLFGVEKLI